jgi:(2R)-3-sulfolactate dehydrogenase (NADP+)
MNAMPDKLEPERSILNIDEIAALAVAALRKAGAGEKAAQSLGGAIARAEAEGLASHGLAYLPTYVEHLGCGKVKRDAAPRVTHPRPGIVAVDADCGFAHPAIDLGFESLLPAARSQGIATLVIRNSYNCGVLGHHTDRIAQSGLLGLGFTNAPASIAPTGGVKPVIGTNPVSLAAPDGQGGTSLLIDQSASVVAKSEIMKKARAGLPIPEGWAFDPQGRPTTDAAVAVKGLMAPAGGQKGVGLGLIVELLAAALSGATLGIDASPFSGTVGGPPKTGQCFIAIDAGAASGNAFAERLARLCAAISDQPGTHLPGSRRAANRARAEREGVAVDAALLTRIRELA